MVDLMDAADKKIGAYSKGMRQRVKLAQAIVHDPALLILDEPLSGMDPLARRRTIRLIRDWARAGKSIIVSSHILHEIESMTANILLINNGRILAEGDVHHIRDLIDEHPHTVFVRAADPRAPRPRVPGARRCAEPAVRAERRGHRDREAGSVLRAPHRDGGDRRVRRHRRGHVARRQPAGGFPVPGEMTNDTDRRAAPPRSSPAWARRLQLPRLRSVARRDAVVAADDLHGAGRRGAGADRAASCACWSALGAPIFAGERGPAAVRRSA